MIRVGFACSNIAWPTENEEAALDLVGLLGFEGLEIAPAKVFGSLDEAVPKVVEDYRRRIEDRGLRIVALQGLLFGIDGISLFESAESRSRLAARLDQVAVIADGLGAVACVFGAPKLRDPGALSSEDAMGVATEFFAGVAGSFHDRGTALCFEANPTSYDCRFATRTIDALDLVRSVSMPGFGLQFDTGTAFINGEDPGTISGTATHATHLHVSEPGLAPLGSSGCDHDSMARSLAASFYDGWISAEMRAGDDWRDSLTLAHELLVRTYAAPSVKYEGQAPTS